MPPRPPKKAARKTRRGPTGLDAERLAISAIDRIRKAVVELEGTTGDGLPIEEILPLHAFFHEGVPPSYQATLERATFLGAPEVLFLPSEIAGVREELFARGLAGRQYVPFARGEGTLLCFDREARHAKKELGLVEIQGSEVRLLAGNFGEWLDEVAVEREEMLARAAEVPEKLARLLRQMGFLRESAARMTVQTSDREALAILLDIRGQGDRLTQLQAGGKALLRINLGTLSLTCTIADREVAFDSSETFRWLRFFRDENFFGDETSPSHPDRVRDLRGGSPKGRVLAGRECIAIHHRFVAASGHPDNFLLLGIAGPDASLVLRVMGGQVTDEWRVVAPLIDVALMDDGSAWGLSSERHALRFTRSSVQELSLPELPKQRRFRALAPTRTGLVVWGRRRIAIGSGLEFTLLHPAPKLASDERIVDLIRSGGGFVALIQGALSAGIATFAHDRWEPIAQDHVLDGKWTAMDHENGVTHLVDEDGSLVRVDEHGAEPLRWNPGGPVASLCATSNAIFATTRGATLYRGPTGDVTAWANEDSEPRKLVGLGERGVRTCAELGGGLVRLWQHGGFEPLDLSKW